MIWTTSYLNDLALEAEIAIAEEVPCIIDRINLNTEAFLNTYQLPDYVSNIRAVYWLGIRLDPIAQIEVPDWPISYSNEGAGTFELTTYESSAFAVSSYTSTGPASKPEVYWFSTYGENILRFFPIPTDTILSSGTGLWGPQISSAVIVEFYRVPDGVNWKIPEYIRKRTIKAYVLWKAFAREGDGQNLKASRYWANKYIILIARAKRIVDNVHQAELRTRSDAVSYKTGLIARPKLPWNWQVITVGDCDDEYY